MDRQCSGYDVIGDVHGHLGALTRLLRELGYRERHGAYSHPDRIAVFVGDLIDRGSQQVGVVDHVRRMVEAGYADVVMGNHEFNAIAYATPHPDRPGDHLRRHTPKNTGQHAAFLDDVGYDSATHQRVIDWFRTLPLWLELEVSGQRLRVIHACWHQESIAHLEPLLGPNRTLSTPVLIDGCTKGTADHGAIETILKGPEVSMGGLEYLDKDGHPRQNARLAWWQGDARSLRDVALVPDGTRSTDGTPFPPLPDTAVDMSKLVYTDEVPVLFGHYWHTGAPATLTPTTACVDYSIAKHGQLVAYRWSGEATLQNDHFVATK